MSRDLSQELRTITAVPSKFASVDDLEHRDVLTILQQGVLLKTFRTASRKVFSDEEVFRLKDAEILSGKIVIAGTTYITSGVLAHILPVAMSYKPDVMTLGMLMDWFHLCKAVKHNPLSSIPHEHMKIIGGISTELQRTVHGIRVDSVYIYTINQNSMVILDEDSQQFSIISMQHILGNWIAGRQLSEHTSRMPSLIYLAHAKLTYKNISKYLAVQGYEMMGQGDQAYVPMSDYNHGMYINEQLTHREWCAIKRHYSFDVVQGKVLSNATISDQVQKKAHALKHMQSTVEAVVTPIPRREGIELFTS